MRRYWPDAAAAALTAAFLVAVTGHIPVSPGERALDAAGYAILVTAAACVGLMRRWPRTVLGVVTATLAAYAVRHYAGGPVFAVGWAALFVLRRRTDRRTALFGAAATCVVLGAVAVATERTLSPVVLVFVGWSLAAVLLGDAVATVTATREQEARRRVAEERLRIARDLHDSVAHALATISVQAGAAEHVIDRRPEAAKEALAAIRRASGDVLDELGAMLTLLRDDEAADRAPTPGLDRIEDLVETGRRNGLRVTLATDGDLAAVPPAVGTAAYRIVQESLTNAVRHAPGSAASVSVDARDGLRVDVRNEGGPGLARHGGTGVGIRGMRERAESTGGRFDAGPRWPGGEFVVTAVWP